MGQSQLLLEESRMYYMGQANVDDIRVGTTQLPAEGIDTITEVVEDDDRVLVLIGVHWKTRHKFTVARESGILLSSALSILRPRLYRVTDHEGARSLEVISAHGSSVHRKEGHGVWRH